MEVCIDGIDEEDFKWLRESATPPNIEWVEEEDVHCADVEEWLKVVETTLDVNSAIVSNMRKVAEERGGDELDYVSLRSRVKDSHFVETILSGIENKLED